MDGTDGVGRRSAERLDLILIGDAIACPMLQRGSSPSGQHSQPALTTSRKPVLLDRTSFCGGLAKAHRSHTYKFQS